MKIFFDNTETDEHVYVNSDYIPRQGDFVTYYSPREQEEIYMEVKYIDYKYIGNTLSEIKITVAPED